MKNLKISFLSFLMVFGLFVNANAQEAKKVIEAGKAKVDKMDIPSLAMGLDEGVITMEITDVSSDNEQVEAQMQMMKGSQTEYHFNADNSLVKMNMMGGMINMTFHTDNTSEDMTMLFDMMGNKMMVESTKAEREESQDEDALDAMKGLKVVYDENDTKEILGYKCVKANISNPEGEEDEGMAFTMYIARDIKASANMIQGLSEIELEGFPLAYELITPQMTMSMEAKDLKKEVSAEAFKLETGGYQKMTMEEFRESMGGMGGGMGF